ncbi:MAG: hypothetical protein ABI365_09565 [Lysobacteraceae bacterium]
MIAGFDADGLRMRWLLVVAMLLLGGVALADAVLAQDSPRAAPANPLANDSDFLAYHPDLGNRKKGMAAYDRGNFALAAGFFRKAARYADKPSQAMFAEMLWKGEGEPVDRTLAYAWMDLAAERGYPSLIAFRENYWNQLSDDERQRAVDVGQSIYAEYGDAIAKPRLALELKRGLSRMTGSRLGFMGNLTIQVPGVGGNWITIPATQYYAPRYWKAQDYWMWQDDIWKVPLHGNVDVGQLESVHRDKPADASHDAPPHDHDEH